MSSAKFPMYRITYCGENPIDRRMRDEQYQAAQSGDKGIRALIMADYVTTRLAQQDRAKANSVRYAWEDYQIQLVSEPAVV